MGDTPDGAVLTDDTGEAIGVVDVGRPVASPLIEVGPCGGLDGEGSGGHRLFAVESIIEAGGRGVPP